MALREPFCIFRKSTPSALWQQGGGSLRGGQWAADGSPGLGPPASPQRPQTGEAGHLSEEPEGEPRHNDIFIDESECKTLTHFIEPLAVQY